MKKRKSVLSKRNFMLCAIALLLVGLTAFGSTVSWIEEVSKVDFDNTSGQQTPAQIGTKILKSDILTREKNENDTSAEIATIKLNDYFNKSGNMHLSPCFGDGENFYFPVNGGTAFRTGTKDDANVNYLSATFRLRSINSASVYWFAHAIDNNKELAFVQFADNGEPDSSLNNYLRCSITIDGATNVYSLGGSTVNDNYVYNKTYKTVENGVITDKTGRNIEQFTYADVEDTGNTVTSVPPNKHAEQPNQGSSGSNLNGNTLFTIPQYDASQKDTTLKTVTIKIWLECPTSVSDDVYFANTVSDIDVAGVNLDLISAWSKTRRIYVHDLTVSEWDSVLIDPDTNESNATGNSWLTNDPKAKLYWALDDDNETTGYKPFADALKSTGTAHWYYLDIPAIYNNRSVALFRCQNNWNGGNKHNDAKIDKGKTIYYWDKWATTFPDTYHSEVFTIYSHKFATWADDADVHKVYFINSAGIESEQLASPHSYMWDTASIYGTRINEKIVQNANWPGVAMTRMADSYKINGKQLYTDFFVSKYNAAVFSDGLGTANDSVGYQTQNLDVSTHYNQYFEMSALKWYSTSSTNITYTNNYLCSNINQNGESWAHTNFLYDGGFTGTTGSKEILRMYVKAQGDKTEGEFKFTVKIGNDYYGNNANNAFYNWVDWSLSKNSDAINIKLKGNKIYDFYLKFDNNNNPSISVKETEFGNG